MTAINSHIPEYKLEENDQEIIISVLAPISRPKEAALLLEKEVFTFDSPPYLLKLKLPHPVCDSFSQPTYNEETRTYLVRLKKNFEYQGNQGEDEFLDLVENLNCENAECSTKKENEQFYGFANEYSKMFGNLYDEFLEVINLPDPDHTDVNERRKLKIQEENEKWSDDHYLADTMETDHLEFLFLYKPPWVTSVKDDYTSDEIQILDKLINKPKFKNLPADKRRLSEYQLVDILFSYAYNKRVTEGDDSVESGWTINKLSSTLSWLEVFEDLKTVLLSCYRRSLIYPFYRNWNLVKLVHKDVIQILKLGSKQVTKSLIEVIEIFNENDNRYILNILYINDLCGFAYHMSNERCVKLSIEVEKINITKYEVNSELPFLEIAAHLTLEEETNSNPQSDSKLDNILKKIAAMDISCSSSTDSSESEDEDSDSSQSSDNELP